MATLKKIWAYLVLGIGIVIGYLFFLKKEDVELEPRPDTKTLPKIPKRPANIDWVKKAEKDINNLNKEIDKAKKKEATFLDLVNKREHEKRKKGK